ncbi:DoxX family protein [Campylobacter sp. FMV-PI01]|uniref:DoxX family protein n=1 Tax=Campylobacter portucalensis TaxID=2608384 RepID=A0A6L5WIT3_9BACT|nr:DoxX family protein [Campylobacter portucalensis]MSN96382.1 DoxX family protein [Campylobacter portucalensis]
MLKILNLPNFGLLLLRIFLGICVLYHGIFKIKYGISNVISILEKSGIPGFLGYFVYVSEVVIPIMIIVGIYTRFACLILILTFGVVLYTAYSNSLFFITPVGGLVPEIVYLYLGISFCLLFCGGGKFVLKND